MVSKRSGQNNDYGGIIKIPFTPLSISFYLFLLVLLFIRLYKKKKLIINENRTTSNEKLKINNKKLLNGREATVNHEKDDVEYECTHVELNDESTMNNLDEIDDNKTINTANNSNLSIIINNKSKQIGFDIFESTLKEINTLNETENFSFSSTKTAYNHEPQIKDNSAFLRKFKNSLISGHKQHENINYYLKHHLNSNCNNNSFEQDYKKERFLSNTKLNKQNHLLGIITNQQTALKNHKILNSNSQLSTTSFFSASDFFLQNKKN